MTSSAEIALTIENTAREIMHGAKTYQICPLGGKVRVDLIPGLTQLEVRLRSSLLILDRLHKEGK
jgi:hypothetical protein